MKEEGLQYFDGIFNAVRDRPGLALTVAAGSGMIIGVLAGGYVLSRESQMASATKVDFSRSQFLFATSQHVSRIFKCHFPGENLTIVLPSS